MKLYLSSEMLPHPDRVLELIGERPASFEIAVINNAFDPYPEGRKASYYRVVQEALEPLGGKQRLLDLREFVGKMDELRDALSAARFIWCSGGNTFSLRYLMRQSGFDTIIASILEEGVVYGGHSAGALVAGPTLEAVDLIDDPTKAPEVIWDGLHLTNTIVWPHWNKEKYQPIQSAIEQRLAALPYPVVKLHDGEAYLIDGDHHELLR